MKEYLSDIIDHTVRVKLDLVKVTGDSSSTKINAIAEDKSVIMSATLNKVLPDFEGVVGIPNLGKLSTIVSFSEYAEGATISVTRNERDGVVVPSAIHFENKSGDFTNDFRLMSQALVEEKVKNVKFNGSSWNVEFQPSIASIGRLKNQALANSEQKLFTTKVVNGDLVVHFGDPSTHSGKFVFHSGVGAMSKTWQWPVQQVRDILDLNGDKTIKITDQGAMCIVVDSGLAVYTYLLPAQTK